MRRRQALTLKNTGATDTRPERCRSDKKQHNPSSSRAALQLFGSVAMKLRIASRAFVVMLACAPGWGSTAEPDSYPSRTVRFILPYSPGGGPDVIARRLAQALAEKTRQSFVVDNKVGASGLIGTLELIKSAPDGHSLALINLATMVSQVLVAATPVNLVRDTAPVALLFRQYTVLVIAPGLPVRNPKEMIDLMKARPGMFFGSGGNGTPAHLAAEIFRRQAAVDASHVPYKSIVTALTDVGRGEIHFAFGIGATAVPLVQSGRLRALAVAAPRRLDVLPDVPTLIEAGFPDPDVNSWTGIVLPAATPAPIVQKLNRLLREVVQDPVQRKAFEALGLEIADGPPDEFAQLLRAETTRWAKFVKEANIRLD